MMMYGWIIGLILVVVLILLLNQDTLRNFTRSGRSDRTPLDILEERYARGEIDQAEYEEKKAELTHSQ